MQWKLFDFVSLSVFFSSLLFSQVRMKETKKVYAMKLLSKFEMVCVCVCVCVCVWLLN